MINLEGLPKRESGFKGNYVLDMAELKVGTILTSEDGLTKLRVILHPLRALGIKRNSYCDACEISSRYTGLPMQVACINFLDVIMGITNRTTCFIGRGIPRVFAIEGEVDYDRYKQLCRRDDV